MHMFKKLALAAALATPGMIVASAPALAQAATGVGVADLEGAVRQTNAYKTAVGQIQTTYKSQIDQINARSTALNNELQPLVTAFQTAQKAPNPNEAALRTQYDAIQKKRAAAQQEISTMSEPIARAQAYVEEQIAGKLDAAVRSAMTAKKVNVLLSPQAILAVGPGVDLTPDIVAQLNASVPSVNSTPPAGWQPGQQQQAAAPAAAAPAAAGAKPKPQGR